MATSIGTTAVAHGPGRGLDNSDLRAIRGGSKRRQRLEWNRDGGSAQPGAAARGGPGHGGRRRPGRGRASRRSAGPEPKDATHRRPVHRGTRPGPVRGPAPSTPECSLGSARPILGFGIGLAKTGPRPGALVADRRQSRQVRHSGLSVEAVASGCRHPGRDPAGLESTVWLCMHRRPPKPSVLRRRSTRIRLPTPSHRRRRSHRSTSSWSRSPSRPSAAHTPIRSGPAPRIGASRSDSRTDEAPEGACDP